jgi:hypothetical protein
MLETFNSFVIAIREKRGTIAFKHNEESLALYVHVELPIPGATGMCVWATYPVADETEMESRLDAARKCYHACRSKLLAMNPPPVPETVEDSDMLKSMGVAW